MLSMLITASIFSVPEDFIKEEAFPAIITADPIGEVDSSHPVGFTEVTKNDLFQI